MPPSHALLTEIYISPELSQAMLNVKPDYMRDDVKQEAFEVLFQKNSAFIEDLHERGKLKAYVVKTIYNTANFSNSNINRQYRRRTEAPTESAKLHDRADDEQEAYDYEALVEACPVKLEAVYWYNRDLLKLYVELGTYRAVAERTGIPRVSVYEAVKKAKEEMQKLLWE